MSAALQMPTLSPQKTWKRRHSSACEGRDGHGGQVVEEDECMEDIMAQPVDVPEAPPAARPPEVPKLELPPRAQKLKYYLTAGLTVRFFGVNSIHIDVFSMFFHLKSLPTSGDLS